MPVLATAVVVLAVLVVLNLTLTAAVIRRLRAAESPRREPVAIAVGARVPRVAGSTFDDGGRTLVAFFSAGCRPCLADAPELVRRTGELSASGIRVVPVLMADTDADPDGMAGLLAPIGPVVREPHHGPLASAFQAQATPGYVLVGDDGRVAARGGTLDECLTPARR